MTPWRAIWENARVGAPARDLWARLIQVWAFAHHAAAGEWCFSTLQKELPSMAQMSTRGVAVIALMMLAGSVSSGAALAHALDPAASDGVGGEVGVRVVQGQNPRVTIPTGLKHATLPTGEMVAMPTEVVWKPVCWAGSPGSMTAADLLQMSESHARLMKEGPVTIVNSTVSRAGLDVVYVLGASVPSAAIPAFAAAEAYLESQFPAENMTLTVTVSFASLGSGILGGTGSSYGSLAWSSSRSTLVAGMDGNDTIQSSLPSGTTIPVRYRANRTTNEDRVFWTFANFKANGGAVSGNDANMQYSTNFPFDYDPSDGVTANTISLQDVIIHETGHAMGFTSGIDFRSNDIEVIDVFRFTVTDGNGDFNPDTAAEFGARPRWAIYNYNDNYNFDTIASEYRLSDGSPWQASHFREQTPAIGIMDPAFNYGETFYPSFLRTSDLTVFDAIGYDR
ncbi:NF038122 family metalloprotease [Nodularia spumigena]|uniref:NF038122 family metalloprotease n=1 Tax=Nodularia spumigena TaxID=70799 RepID=UPI002B1FCC11|nr:NF038122 family metalloprotease [Nodularia spumigena]